LTVGRFVFGSSPMIDSRTSRPLGSSPPVPQQG
jgi:hypothetical protein